MKIIKVCLTILCVYTIGYSIYQLGYALPFNQYAHLREEWAKPHLGLREGFKKALFSFTKSRDFDTWGGIGFFIYPSCYFTICTWMNLTFSLAPRKLIKK